ncbi:MAG: hypothetical protein R2699_08740 [Acidimicrobiales bacterium]
MTISNKMLLTLLAFVAGAVGLSMYVGMRIGLDAASATTDATVAMTPAVASAPVTPAATSAAPATITTDQCAFLLAVASHRTDHAEAEAAAPAGEVTIEEGDFATNSGVIDGSQFNDGGFGDIGQQWWGVTVNGNVTNVNVDSGGSANVAVGSGSTTPPPAAPVLAETPAAPVTPVVPSDPAPTPEPPAPAPAPAGPVPTAPAPSTSPVASTPDAAPAAVPQAVAVT